MFQVLVVAVPYTVKKQSMEDGRKGETEGRIEGDSEEGREKRNRSNNIYNSHQANRLQIHPMIALLSAIASTRLWKEREEKESYRFFER